jgi:CubicO group peptidase (beta-lactamase class C family)
MKRAAGVVLVLALVFHCGAACAQDRFGAVDELVHHAIGEHLLPGAVVVVGHDGRVVLRRAYGMRSLEPTREAMTVDTIFDMASLTKCLATAIMQLYQRGELQFDDPVAKYLPEFAANGKQNITIRELLTHYSGLPPDLPLGEPWEGKETAYRMAFAVAPAGPAGEKFVYSDINFVVLGALVEKLSGMTLDEYTRRFIMLPMGLLHTRYSPLERWIPQIAPTQYEHGASAYGVSGLATGPGDVMLRGVVHDPTSRRMGGVAGHAGLFSSGDDVAVYAQNLLDRLAGRPSRFPLSRRVLQLMVKPEQPAGGKAARGFGWDIDSPYSSNRGSILPVGSFGHTGFTGTSLWMDPVSDTYVIILANSVHPNGPKRITQLRGQIADAAAEELGIHRIVTGPMH